MGSGSSAKRGGGSLESPGAGPAKYRAPVDDFPAGDDPDKDDDDDVNGKVRPCDRCGETRRTARLGGGEAQWLCAACQLASGTRMAPRIIKVDDSVLAPQPQLRRGATVAMGGTGRGSPPPRPRRRESETDRVSPRHAAEGEAAAPRDRKSRRRAKGLAPVPGDRPKPNPNENRRESAAPALPLRRAQTSLDLKLSPRNNFRSVEGLRGIKGQMGVPTAVQEDPVVSYGGTASDGASSSKGLAPLPKKKLAGGFSVGDRVQSLISRLRGGLLVLELGHEGTVVGVAMKGDPANASEDDLRLLVQFKQGFDWLLSLRQICPVSTYPSTRAAGLPGGFNWGVRIRSLVTYLKPSGARKEVWLGDMGTVIGPGLVKGKLAVRFEDGRGEWSVWPPTICQAEAYNRAVAERLSSGLCRGDRVRARGQCKGDRNRVSYTLNDGEEGTVVGPGHAGDCLLVHFDSDERVWSMSPSQISADSTCL
mmetsp:Transcript_109248/g.309076  ORF Transcript_109248/g.309076 Transcript_109248/m.309076 type:complete len:478 (-) Transcript_109248:182-1615(-)